MRETLDILKTYIGERPLALLIAAALVVVLIKSRDRVTRTLLGWLSLAVTALFLFPASYALYCRLDGPETYYRLLWLIPAATLLAWAVATLAVPPETGEKEVPPETKAPEESFLPAPESRRKRTGRQRTRRALLVPFLCAALIVVCGDYTYDNIHITRAENRLHLPQTVINLCDYIVSQAEGSRNIQAAFPSEFVHYVRQYNTDIRLSFGREMMVERWGFSNPVYDQMEAPEEIDAEALAEALIDDECRFVVLHAARPLRGRLEDYGYEKLVLLDGYYVYKNAAIPIA